MRLTCYSIRLHELAFENGSDAMRTFAPVANEPDSAAGQPFDCGDADLLLEAAGNDRAFIKVEI